MNQRWLGYALLVSCGFVTMTEMGCGGGTELPVIQNGNEILGGSGANDGGAPGTDAGGDSRVDAGGPIDGGPALTCGAATCSATQYCLNPCCGGARPRCIDKPTSGVCPAGFHPASCDAFPQGCEQDACVPPPPRCVDDPKQGGCTLRGRELICLCA
jgi:hypothetical protein